VTIGDSQVVNITDQNFLQALIDEGVDSNSDGVIQESEALNTTFLWIQNKNISSLEGINNFTNLTNLRASENNLSSVAINGLTKLSNLDLSHNQIQEIDLTGSLSDNNTVRLSHNLLTEFVYDDEIAFDALYLGVNDISKFSISNNSIAYIHLYPNPLDSVEIKICPTSKVFLFLQIVWKL